MHNRGGGSRFSGKSFPRSRDGCQMRSHHFDGDQSIQLFLKSFEHNAVCSLADELTDFNVSQATEGFLVLCGLQKIDDEVAGFER